jgi:hypothetical protein
MLQGRLNLVLGISCFSKLFDKRNEEAIRGRRGLEPKLVPILHLLNNTREKGAQTFRMLGCFSDAIRFGAVQSWAEKHLPEHKQRKGRPLMHLQDTYEGLQFHERHIFPFGMLNRIASGERGSNHHNVIGAVLFFVVPKTRKVERGIRDAPGPAALRINDCDVGIFAQRCRNFDIGIAPSTNLDSIEPQKPEGFCQGFFECHRVCPALRRRAEP